MAKLRCFELAICHRLEISVNASVSFCLKWTQKNCTQKNVAFCHVWNNLVIWFVFRILSHFCFCLFVCEYLSAVMQFDQSVYWPHWIHSIFINDKQSVLLAIRQFMANVSLCAGSQYFAAHKGIYLCFHYLGKYPVAHPCKSPIELVSMFSSFQWTALALSTWQQLAGSVKSNTIISNYK